MAQISFIIIIFKQKSGVALATTTIYINQPKQRKHREGLGKKHPQKKFILISGLRFYSNHKNAACSITIVDFFRSFIFQWLFFFQNSKCENDILFSFKRREWGEKYLVNKTPKQC